MSAGELGQQQQKQRPRRQSARRSSTPSSSLDITAAAAADDSAKDAAGVARRSRSKQQQQQQQDTQDHDATVGVAKPPRSSKRQKANSGNVSIKDDVHIVTDSFDNDTGAAEDGSAAASRRSTPAAAAAAVAEEDSAAAAGDGSSDSATGLTAFEAQRAARIAQNMARLAALELPEMAAGLAAAAAVKPKAAAAPTQRGISTKRKRSDQQQQPQRQSARTRGQAPDPTTAAGIDREGRDGKVILAAAAAWNPAAAAAAGSSDPAAAAAAPPPPPGPLPFRSANGDESSDAHFLALLQRMQCTSTAAAAGSSDGDESSSSSAMRGHDLSRLSLSSVDVAKMTKDGVSCLAFHPASDKLIIAAADKQGQVSLWDIDHHQQQQQQQSEDNLNGSSSSSDYDGVLMFTPYLDYVSSLKWLMGGSKLMTGSYDGTVRLLDVTSGVWDLVQGYCPDAAADGWSAGDAAADGYVIYTATSAGHMTVIDTRCDNGSSSSSSSWVIANRKVNTLHLHANQNHVASSASDGSVAVWDVRKLAPPAAAAVGSSSSSYNPKSAKPLYQLSHTKSSQAAYWNPDGSNQLLSISFDDTLRIWGDDTAAGGDMTQKVLIRHNNNTGRWVVPFRPAWSPSGDAVLVGDLKRGVAVFDSSSGRQLALLQSDALTAIPSRLAMHPSAGVKAMAAATSSGRVHIWR